MKAKELRVGMLVYLPKTADGREEIQCAELSYKGKATGANKGLLELFWNWRKQGIFPGLCEEFVDPEMEIGELVSKTPFPLGRAERECLLLLSDGWRSKEERIPLDIYTLRGRTQQLPNGRQDWGTNHRLMIDKLRKRGFIENTNHARRAMWALTVAGKRVLDQ